MRHSRGVGKMKHLKKFLIRCGKLWRQAALCPLISVHICYTQSSRKDWEERGGLACAEGGGRTSRVPLCVISPLFFYTFSGARSVSGSMM